MFTPIQQFFQKYLAPDAAAQPDDQGLMIAAAALLVEAARADFSTHAIELESVLNNVSALFDLDESQAQDIVHLATEKLDSAACLHEFTQVLMQEFTMQQRIEVIHLLWKVAQADGRIDQYEEHLIRKIADLLYVSHNDYILEKQRVLQENSVDQVSLKRNKEGEAE